MDKFERAMKKLEEMKPDDSKDHLAKKERLCDCIKCPSYNKCAGDGRELLFCLKWKSNCITDQAGCICNTCPVAEELGLNHMYYCLQGNEKEMRRF
jgi:hypothetical protein